MSARQLISSSKRSRVQSSPRPLPKFLCYLSWVLLLAHSCAQNFCISAHEKQDTCNLGPVSFNIKTIFPGQYGDSHYKDKMVSPLDYLYDVKIPILLNTLRPRQYGRHFPDDIFKRIFLNEIIWVSIKISLKFVPKGSISNIPALVQIMAWRRPGNKPLSDTILVSLPMHICVTRPQWVKTTSLYHDSPLISTHHGIILRTLKDCHNINSMT